MGNTKKTGIFDGLKGKQRLWLKHFLNEANPQTFLNNTESAISAGYKCKDRQSFGEVGCQNSRKLKDRIGKWLDEDGLSENRLKQKLISLTESKQVHFHKIKGHVDPKELPPGVIVMAQAHIMKWNRGDDDEFEPYDDGDTVVAIPVEALETQRRSLDMAMKIKGMFEKDNKQKKPEVLIVESIPPEKREALNKAYQTALMGED